MIRKRSCKIRDEMVHKTKAAILNFTYEFWIVLHSAFDEE